MGLERRGRRGRAQRARRARPRGRERDAARRRARRRPRRSASRADRPARRAASATSSSTARCATSPSIVGRSASSKSRPPWPATSSKNVPNRPDSRPGKPKTRGPSSRARPRSRARTRDRAARGSPTARARRRCAARTAARPRSGTARPPSARAGEPAPSTSPSSGRSHSACDGAYFECVDEHVDAFAAPQELGDPPVQRRVIGVDDDLDVEPVEDPVQAVVHRPADERDPQLHLRSGANEGFIMRFAASHRHHGGDDWPAMGALEQDLPAETRGLAATFVGFSCWIVTLPSRDRTHRRRIRAGSQEDAALVACTHIRRPLIGSPPDAVSLPCCAMITNAMPNCDEIRTVSPSRRMESAIASPLTARSWSAP